MKAIQTFILLMIVCKLAFAQEDIIALGIKTSVGQSIISNQKSIYHYSYIPSYDLGFTLTSLRTHSIGYSFNIDYATRGADANDVHIQLAYLVASFGINKFITKSNTTFFLGPYLSALLNKSNTIANPFLNSDVNDEFKKYDFGLSGKLNQRIIKIEKYIAGIEFCTSYGLANIYNNKFVSISSKENKWSRNVNLNLGITIQYIGN